MEQGKIRFHLEGGLCVILALMLLLLPLKWVLAMIVATIIHELCHALFILFFGCNIYAIHLGARGIRMETDALPPGQELIAALAGPVGSATLIMLSSYFPRLAICGAVHCIYNLLPLYPLDGGCVLKNLIVLCLPNCNNERIFRRTQRVIRVALVILCALAVMRFGMVSVLVGLLVLLQRRKKKVYASSLQISPKIT